MRVLRRSLTGIFLLALTLVLVLWAANMLRGAIATRMNDEPRSFTPRERIVAVNVVTLTPQRITPQMTVFGELRSRRTLDLRSATGGTVLSINDALIDGGAVQEGDLLLRLDPAQAVAARDRARADLQDARAELRDAERALALVADELAAAQAQADLRTQALARTRDLQDRGVGTTAAVEAAELAQSAAAATVLTRRQALAAAQARIDQATTRLARADISVTEATRAVADTEIVAAFDGSLSDVTVSPGGRIAANERFARLLDPTRLEVMFRVSTAQYTRLLEADGTLITAPLTVALNGAGVNLLAIGQITRAAATVATGETGRTLFGRVEDAAGFRPGDFVTVRIDEPALDNVALIPATALGADQTLLVVGQDDRLQTAPVRLLRRQDNDVIVTTDGVAGATIVAERSPLLGTGIKVRPVPPGDTAQAEPAAMITLDADRRARLIAFVTAGQMPDDVKARLIGQLQADEVSSDTVSRLERRMGS